MAGRMNGPVFYPVKPAEFELEIVETIPYRSLLDKCGNCRLWLDEHAEGGKCPFETTYFVRGWKYFGMEEPK